MVEICYAIEQISVPEYKRKTQNQRRPQVLPIWNRKILLRIYHTSVAFMLMMRDGEEDSRGLVESLLMAELDGGEAEHTVLVCHSRWMPPADEGTRRPAVPHGDEGLTQPHTTERPPRRYCLLSSALLPATVVAHTCRPLAAETSGRYRPQLE